MRFWSAFSAWFLRHFLTQCWWATVQQMVQDQMRELRTTWLMQMTHSYWPWSMSSWIRVARSVADDLGALLVGDRGQRRWASARISASRASWASHSSGVSTLQAG